tara:strand:- start:1186 stop:2580 length:1395 start_codon:yes stop_codon:yes gene_type:complete
MALTDTTYYLDTTLFSNATAVWSDSSLSTKAPDGWYQAPSESTTIYRQQTSGLLGLASNCQCGVACGSNISASGSQGYYTLSVDMGSTTADVGAIIIYFEPFGIPDGIVVLFNNEIYNKLSSPTNGYLAAPTPFGGTATSTVVNKLIDSSADFTSSISLVAVGDRITCVTDSVSAFVTAIDSSTQLSLSADIMASGEAYKIGQATYIGTVGNDCGIGSTTYNLNTSTYTGSSFPNPSTPQVVLTPVSSQSNLTASSPGYSTMVIPKTTATPSTLEANFIGPCSGTAFNIEVACPVSLPSFTCSTVEAVLSDACGATQDQTYYYAKNRLGTNILPVVNNWVFSDINGANTLANGYYRLNNGTAILVANGVVTTVATCSGGGPSYAVITATNPGGTNIAVVYRSDLYSTNTIFSNTIGATAYTDDLPNGSVTQPAGVGYTFYHGGSPGTNTVTLDSNGQITSTSSP